MPVLRRNPSCGQSVIIAMAFAWFIVNPTIVPLLLLVIFLVLFR